MIASIWAARRRLESSSSVAGLTAPPLVLGTDPPEVVVVVLVEPDEFDEDFELLDELLELLDELLELLDELLDDPDDELLGTGETKVSTPSIWSSPVASVLMIQFMLSEISEMSYWSTVPDTI